MENKKKISKSGIFSYCLLIIYFLLKLVLREVNQKYAEYAFIVLHILIICLGILIFSWIYFAMLIGLVSKKVKKSDKKNIRLVIKTMPHRIFLSLFYWAAPIGTYFYYISLSPYLYIFKWLPLWYPIVYYFSERYIRNKEKNIGSPVVKFDSNGG